MLEFKLQILWYAICTTHFNNFYKILTYFLTLHSHICYIISQCCLFLCRIPSWRCPTKGRTVRRLAVWLHTSVSNSSAVVGINRITKIIVLVVIVSRLWAELSGFDSRQGQEIFPIIGTSEMSLGPTQSPIQWVQPALYHEVKRSVCEPLTGIQYRG